MGRRFRLLVRRELAQHLGSNRQDERETVVALHPADRDADEVPALIEHAAARHPRVTVGQAGHEPVRRPLAHVAAREDDPFRVIVPEAEDRIGEVVGERGVDVQRRQIQIARLDNRPVAVVYFPVGVARVDHLRGNLLAAVDHLHRLNPAAALPVVLVAQRDDRVLHRDEVTAAQVARGPVIGLAEVVVGIQFDETRTPVAQQVHRHQPHLGLQLLLDLGDHARAARAAWLGVCRVALSVEPPARAGRHERVARRLAELGTHFAANRVELLVI